MTRHSLRLRLLVVAALATGLAVGIAAVGLIALFDRHVERRIDAELGNYLRQLAGDVVINADGTAAIHRRLAEPRFDEPYSGLYWQVQSTDRKILLRSRSLWDTELALPANDTAKGLRRRILAGPEHEQLIALDRQVTYEAPSGPRSLQLTVAIDRHDLDRARRDFAVDMLPFLAVLTAAFLVAVWFQVGIGLRPLRHLREGLQRVRSGETRRLDGRFPDEVDPLVREVNDLLLAQETAIERARSRAADLAHGLKTPLTVLTADAARLQAKGETEISTELLDLAGAMRRQVDQELVRARIDATQRATHPPLPVAPVAERLMRALQRMPKGETITWDSGIPPEITLAVDPDDLAEMLGNLLENAVKWARHEIRLTGTRSAAGTDLSVEDDGPGVPADQIAALGRRGVRLDRTVQGSGRGLAIVGDIIAAYGGEIRFDAMRPETAPAPLGGLRVTLHFPQRPAGRERGRQSVTSE